MSRGPDLMKCEVWRRRFGRFDPQQETVGQFCEREQVSVANYYQWRRKLEEMAKSRGAQSTRLSRGISAVPAPAIPSREHDPRSSSALQFLPLEITGPTTPTAARVEVLLPSGIQVRVPCHETAALQTVLAVLCQRLSEEPGC